MVLRAGAYAKLVTYFGGVRVEVVGKVGRLSPRFGVQFSEVLSVIAAAELERGRLKQLFTHRWLKFVEVRRIGEEEALGYVL